MSIVSSILGAAGATGQQLNLPHVDYTSIYPEALLTIGAVVLLVFNSLSVHKASVRTYAVFTGLIGVGSVVSTLFMWDQINANQAHSTIAGAIANDRFSVFFAVTIGSAVVLSSLIAGDWLKRHQLEGPEFFALAMLSGAGGMLMAAANDLIVVFLGLEILSIALYVMAGLNSRSARSREAALKYFILGAFSSAVFLYGIALVYGATGTTNLGGIANFLSSSFILDNGLMLAGMALLAVGFAFKVAAVPFHMWTPDVYQGSPTPAVAFMAAAAKAAGFAAFLRVFSSTFFTLKLDWQPMILVLAIVTLLVGSIAACVQKNVKRMLAYSSISHAGYILLGLQAANSNGIGGALFYIFAYTFIVIGSFAIVSVIEGRRDGEHDDIDAFRGLARRNPGVALAFTVLLLAQAGVPLTSGFLSKFYVISALVQNGSYATAAFAMVVAAIAGFFYLRLVFVMYSSAEDVDADNEVVADPQLDEVTVPDRGRFILPAGTWLSVGIAVIMTVAVGVVPSNLIDFVGFARRATTDLF